MLTIDNTNNPSSHKKRPSLSQQAASILFSSSSRSAASNVFSRNSNSNTANPPLSRFEELLQSTDMPPSGPEYYTERRRLWLRPGWENTPRPRPRSNTQKLEAVVNGASALHEDSSWRRIDRVWKNLANGTRLSEGLPMAVVVRLSSFHPICTSLINHHSPIDKDCACCMDSRSNMARWFPSS